jgi:tRNA(Ile)-lysidine synthase
MLYNYRMDLILIQQILQNCKIHPDQLLIVGVSGGADSLCLMDLLHRSGLPILAAHFNHQLRSEADADEAFVKDYATKIGVSWVVGRGDVKGFALQNGFSLEEAARKKRYSFLFEQARVNGAQAVAVAHHAGDQVETILMHFVRGSGIAGLRGMQYRTVLPEWDAFIPLIRPLLGVERAEVEEYCLDHGLQPRQDETNTDVNIFRNRLRLELIPEIESYNPNFKTGVRRMGEVLAGEESLLKNLTEQAWRDCCRQLNPEIVRIFPESFSAFPRPLQRRLLRYGASKLLPDLRDLDFNAVERCLEFLAGAPHHGRMDVVDHLILEADYDAWFLMKQGAAIPLNEFPQVAEGGELILSVPGEIELENGWWITAKVCAKPGDYQSQENSIIWLDAELLHEKLILRQPRRGEQFQPLGMSGKSVKLADFFTNMHLPRRARAGWPIVFSGDKVIWVVGKRVGDYAKLQPRTQRVICLQLIHH